MIAAVDSSVLLDILKEAPRAKNAAMALETLVRQGSVCVCAPVIAEVGRYFSSNEQMLNFLSDAQIDYSEISLVASLEAARMMRNYTKNTGSKTRVAADFLIGAHALKQADCLLTTDKGFFRGYFKGLKIVNPGLLIQHNR